MNYHYLHDVRGFSGESPSADILVAWRPALRKMLFDSRKALSDLTFMPLSGGFEMHEGLFPRSVVPGSVRWSYLLFSGPNCFLLRPEEHQPEPPSRTLCYWLSVVRYGKSSVDAWISSLPFRVAPPMPWNNTCGVDVINKHLERTDITSAGRAYFTRPNVAEDLVGDCRGF